MPSGVIDLSFWWLIGGMAAASFDVGMVVIVWSITIYKEKWLKITLVIIAIFVAYCQVIYASHHFYPYPIGDLPEWLDWLQEVIDIRVIFLPVALPLTGLIYAFAAERMRELESDLDNTNLIPIQLQAENDKLQSRLIELESEAIELVKTNEQLESEAIELVSLKQELQLKESELVDATNLNNELSIELQSIDNNLKPILIGKAIGQVLNSNCSIEDVRAIGQMLNEEAIPYMVRGYNQIKEK
jgi:hypothetical protein